MAGPVLLIAEREFRTYVATGSFWLALALAPAIAAFAFFLFGARPAADTVSITAGTRSVTILVAHAVQEAGRLEGRTILVGDGNVQVRVVPSSSGLDLDFDAAFPLSATARSLAAHIVERDLARGHASQSYPHIGVTAARPTTADMDKGARLTVMVALWLALTGSLGMLLQAIVRERSNRALESLLASADPWHIIVGKIAGVGLVSLLVLFTWYATAFLLSAAADQASALAPLLSGFSDPLLMTRNLLIYVCAFVFYGALTMTVGALARDSASAQNLARPMFMCLLVAFLIAMFGADENSAMSWLIWLPPFTPFLLLAKSTHSVALLPQMFLLLIMTAASLLTLFSAVTCLSFSPLRFNMFRRITRVLQLMG